MHFVGTDIRNLEQLKLKNKNIETYTKKSINNSPSDWQAELISDSQQFADHILVSTPDLLQIVPSAKYYPVMIDLNRFQEECNKAALEAKNSFFKTDKVKVLHAPSNFQLKGSDAIDRVLKKVLKTNDNIEYLNTKHLNRETGTVYTVSRYELFQLYHEADIVIDQMVIGWYGLQSIEALLANCQVICYIEDDLKKYLFPNCPIISANINELAEVLIKTVHTIESTKVNYSIPFDWVKKHHTIEKQHSELINTLE